MFGPAFDSSVSSPSECGSGAASKGIVSFPRTVRLMTRIFFATDLHGSEVCWKKFLNAPEFYDVSVLILGGDMTGKALIPLVGAQSRYEVVLQEHRYVLASADEVQQMERRIAGHGYYAVRVDPDQMAALQANPQEVEPPFQEQMSCPQADSVTPDPAKLSGQTLGC